MSNIAQLGFEHLNPKFKIDKPVRLIELFAGIGSQAKALQNLGVDFEKWVISEWEVNPTKSYKAIHHENDNTDYSKGLNQKELINILFKMGISNDGKKPMTLQQIARKNEKWLRETYNAYKATHNISNIMSAAGSDLNIVDTENYIYIMTYSFPCQDLSIAGKQAGMAKGSQTRSGTLWEVERLLNECTELPQVLLMENVTQVHSKANIADFTLWQEFLKSKGYTNFIADLNAKDYEVPQNRNRCFMVSLLGDYSYTFPLPKPLTKRLKDILETDVNEKYYLSSKAVKYITNPKRMDNNFTNINSDIAIPLTAKGQSNWTGSFVADDQLNLVGNINPSGNGIAASRGRNPDNPNDRTAGIELQQRLEIKTDGTSNTLTTLQKDNLVVEPMALDEQNGYVRTDGCVGTVMTDGNSPKHNNRVIEPNCRVRKLTPKECFRLMAFDDADYEKCKAAGISDSALYKQAGNSIVVKVLMVIFKELICEIYEN